MSINKLSDYLSKMTKICIYLKFIKNMQYYALTN